MNFNHINRSQFRNFSKPSSASIKRLIIISFIFSVFGLVVMIKIFEINLKESIKTKIIENKEIFPKVERGKIKDRNGRILSTNIIKYDLKAYPKNIHNAEETIRKLLSSLPNLDKESLRNKFNNTDKYEVIIKKNIIAPLAKEVNSMGIPGLEFFPVTRRYYPHQNLTAHIVGHTNISNHGVYGAEKTFDSILNSGKDIKLALDLRVQYAVREEMFKAYNNLGAKSATAIIADLRNFEILSLVSLPDFNPNISINPKIESYRNSATLNVYEMGSTFKIFTIAAALEESRINLKSLFDARKPLKVSNYFIRDHHPENRILSTKEVFIKSSNIGASRIGLDLGPTYLKQFYKKLGILNFSSIDLSEKSRPIIPEAWGEIQTATLSFGHGISVTPMHMIEASSLIFSEFELIDLSIKKREQLTRKKSNEFLSVKNRSTLLSLMRENVVKGTGKNADIKGYEIGGKTATGEKTIKGRYKKNKLVSSFLAIFPTRDPEYISLILFDEPNYRDNKNLLNNFTGGATAAPVTASILERILPILGMTNNIEKEHQLIVKNKDKLNFVSN